MFDIVGIGTVLIDFTPNGVSKNGNTLYEQNPGGSIANFLVAATRRGARCACISKVGDDMFGRFLRKTLTHEGIDVRGVSLSPAHLTPCAFVRLGEKGEREFVFYHHDTADVMLAREDVPLDILEAARAVHVTSLILSGSSSRKAALHALDYARARDKLITYDINWREDIWKDKDSGLAVVGEVIRQTDILKVSDEELVLLTDEFDANTAAQAILARGPRLLVVTSGERGSSFYTPYESGHALAYPAKPIDTTGAGDCHFGVFVEGFVRGGMCVDYLERDALLSLLKAANKAAAQCVEGYGGIPSIPYANEFTGVTIRE